MAHESRTSEDSTEAAVIRRGFQFSLRGGWFLVTLVCCVLVSVTQIHLPVTRVLLLISSVLVGAGLLGQSRDIRRHAIPPPLAAQRPAMPVAVRAGWTFAARWRVAIVVLLAAFWCFECVIYVNSILPEYDARFLGYLGAYRTALLYLLLIIGLATTPRCVLLEARGSAKVVTALGWLAALVWFGIALVTSGLVASLYHMAFSAIENWQPYRTGSHVIHEVHLRDLQRGLVMLSVAAGSSFLAVIAATSCLVAGTRPHFRPSTRRRFLTAHGICLATATLLAIWIRVFGLAKASPYLAAFPFAELSPYHLGLATLLVVIVSCCMSQRLATFPSDLQLPWRRASYVHDGRMVCAFCFVSVLAERGWSPYLFAPNSGWLVELLRLRWLTEVVEEPTAYLGACLLVVAVVGLIGHRRNRGEEALFQGRELQWVPFTACWVTSALTLIVTAEAVLWTSFVVWLW